MAQGEISSYFIDGAAATSNGYRSKKANIPFATNTKSTGPRLNVKLLYSKFDPANGDADFRAAFPSIRNKAANRFILHYFPEYYTFYRVLVRDKERSIGSFIDTQEMGYRRLRETIKDNLLPRYYTSATKPATESVVMAFLNQFRFGLTASEVETLKFSTGQSSPIYNKIRNLQAPAATELAYFYTHSPVEMKTLLTLLELIPTGTQVDASFELFNSDENITPGSKTTTLQISSFMADNKAANDGLGAYQQQLDGFEGSLPINLNFTDMQKGVFTILNGVIMQNLMRDLTDVHNSATVGGPYLDFAAADSLEITFGTKREHGDVPSKTCIASIKYFVAQSSLSQQHMRVGYMTNILYNKEFSNQLVLSTLKNYEFLVRSMRAADAFGGPNLSFTDFLDENAGDFGLEGNTVWEDIPNPAAVVEDMNLKEAVRLGIIDLEDVKSLEKGFEAFLTPEQLDRYKREVIENPEFQKKLKAAKRKMAFSTAKDINKIIIGFLEGSPEGVGIKKNSPLGQFIRKIGIQELAMEAMICATFGLAPSFARIGRAAQSALQQTQAGTSRGASLGGTATSLAAKAAKIRLAQLGRPPKAPKPSIKLPKVNKKMFEPPTLDKELWESLKKSMLDSLMKGAMEVIKSLAALLKELCKINNPYAQDEGATDVGDLVRDNLDQNFKDAPAISNESALDQMFGNDGLTPEQVLGDGTIDNKGYLSDLSAILTSMEICFLFTDRSQVTDFTLDKIVDFNLTYPDLQIQQNLNTPTAVLSFFANLSRFVDITDLCNKIATDLYNANIDNICLVEEKAPELIDKILEDLATNGMELDSPFPYNLQCPLREDYINNPLVSSTIPSFLGSVQEAVEIEFVNGLSAALQILKEPVITSSESTAQIAGVLQAAGLIGGTGPGPDQFSEFGPDLDASAADKADDIMKKVTEVFQTIEDKINHLDRYCDVGALLGVEGQDLVGVTQTIISVLLNFVQQGDFINAIRDLDRRLSELSAAANSAAGLSSVATQYEFPVSFREDFASYIDKQSAEVQAAFGTFSPTWNGTDPNINLVDTKQLATRTIQRPVSQEFGQLKATSNAPSPIAGKFMPLTLDYRFPTKAAPFIEEDGNLLNEITGLPVRVGGKIIPKFVVRDSNTPDDYLRLTFLPASSAGADVQFSMNSNLFGNSFLSQFSDPGPLSRDYSITSGTPGGTDINTYVSPFTNVLYSKLRASAGLGGQQIGTAAAAFGVSMRKDPDAGSDFDLTEHQDERTHVKGTISSILFPALYAGQTEAMFDFIQRNGIFDTPRLDSLNFFFDNRSCIPDNVADLLDMGPGTNACGPSILDEVNEELLQALCHDGADPDDLNPQGTQIRDVVRHFSFLVLLQIHIAQFVVKNIFVFSAFEIDDLMTLGTIKEFMAVNIRNQVQKLIETKPIVGENLVKYYNKKIQRAPVINQGGLLDTDGNVVFPPTKRFRQSDVPAIIEYMTKDRITKSRCAVANAVKRSSDLTSPKDFDRVFVEDVLTVVPSFFGARILGTQYTPNISSDQPMIQVRQQNSSTGISENGFYGALHTSPTHDPGGHIDERTALMNNIPSYFGGSEGVLTGNWVGIAEPAKWRGFDRQMKYGKIVLERQVIWDSVERHGGVPPILEKTTGAEYGLEKDLFEQVLYNDSLKTGGNSPGADLSVPLEFTNLRFKYNIVYYMPTVHSPTSDQPMAISEIFSQANPFYSDAFHGTRADHKLSGMELSRYVLTSLNGHLPLRSYISTDDTELISITQQVSGDANDDGITAPGETILQVAWQNRPVLKTILSEYGTTVSDSELQLIVNDAIFKDYFDKSINRSVTSLVPILENFYLTSNFFPKMDNILQGAKDRCLGIYIDSILNQTPQPPGRTVSPQALAAAGLDPEDPLAGLTTSARDFILKMLIETPINILRGVAETMDPHVGISKIIREITAHVFNEMAKGIDVSPPVKFLRDGPAPAVQQGPPAAQQEGPAYADNAPAGTQMYTYDDDSELEYARVPGGGWMIRKRGFTTKWTPLASPGSTGISIVDLEQNAEPLNAADYYSSLPEQLRGLVEYKIPGDVVNDYATFTNSAGTETFWATRKRAGNTSWENATRVTSPTLIQRLADNAVPRYSTAQHGTTLNQADLDAAAAEIQASLAELPASRPTLSEENPGPNVVNEDVRILQAKLQGLAATQDPPSVLSIGHWGSLPGWEVDGRFGDRTKISVKALQEWATNVPMTGEMDGATWAALEQALTEQAQAHLEAQAGTGGGILPNIKGENIMNLLFCLLEMGMQDAATGFNLGNGPKNSPDWENFVGDPGGGPGIGPGSNTLAAFIGNPVVPGSDPLFPLLTYVQGDNDPRDPRNTIPDDLRGSIFPKFSMKGVDFTGTLLGLLMLPPGPFGIVYLLLMLLGRELEDALTPDEDGTTTDGPTNVSEEQSGERC